MKVLYCPKWILIFGLFYQIIYGVPIGTELSYEYLFYDTDGLVRSSQEARQFCEREGGQLATLETKEKRQAALGVIYHLNDGNCTDCVFYVNAKRIAERKVTWLEPPVLVDISDEGWFWGERAVVYRYYRTSATEARINHCILLAARIRYGTTTPLPTLEHASCSPPENIYRDKIYALCSRVQIRPSSTIFLEGTMEIETERTVVPVESKDTAPTTPAVKKSNLALILSIVGGSIGFFFIVKCCLICRNWGESEPDEVTASPAVQIPPMATSFIGGIGPSGSGFPLALGAPSLSGSRLALRSPSMSGGNFPLALQSPSMSGSRFQMTGQSPSMSGSKFRRVGRSLSMASRSFSRTRQSFSRTHYG